MQDHGCQTPIVIPEATIHPTVMPEQTDIPPCLAEETEIPTCDESVRIITYQPRGHSMFGRQLKKSKAVSSPFVIPHTKRPKFDENWNITVDVNTTVDIDPIRGIDDLQLDIQLNQWMLGAINVNRPMKFVPSFYKVILGEAEDGWLADEVTSLYLN